MPVLSDSSWPSGYRAEPFWNEGLMTFSWGIGQRSISWPASGEKDGRRSESDLFNCIQLKI